MDVFKYLLSRRREWGVRFGERERLPVVGLITLDYWRHAHPARTALNRSHILFPQNALSLVTILTSISGHALFDNARIFPSRDAAKYVRDHLPFRDLAIYHGS